MLLSVSDECKEIICAIYRQHVASFKVILKILILKAVFKKKLKIRCLLWLKTSLPISLFLSSHISSLSLIVLSEAYFFWIVIFFKKSP